MGACPDQGLDEGLVGALSVRAGEHQRSFSAVIGDTSGGGIHADERLNDVERGTGGSGHVQRGASRGINLGDSGTSKSEKIGNDVERGVGRVKDVKNVARRVLGVNLKIGRVEQRTKTIPLAPGDEGLEVGGHGGQPRTRSGRLSLLRVIDRRLGEFGGKRTGGEDVGHHGHVGCLDELKDNVREKRCSVESQLEELG